METEISDFTPRWGSCVDIFAEEAGQSSQQNENHHFQKHVVTGREWGQMMSLQEYRERAKNHLNALDPEQVIELCQAEDGAVVKYNLDTGELGIACRTDGKIKTFFCPGTFRYVVRKLEQGFWGNPEIAQGFLRNQSAISFDDDAEKAGLFLELQSLSCEIPETADLLLADFVEQKSLDSKKLLEILSQMAQARFCAYELEGRILTEDQEDIVENLDKTCLRASAVFDVIERQDIKSLLETIQQGVEVKILEQEGLWRTAKANIREIEDFEIALEKRDLLGFVMMELRIKQIHGHLTEIPLQLLAYRLKKSDIFLRRWLYPLVKKFDYKDPQRIVPNDFFWRKRK